MSMKCNRFKFSSHAIRRMFERAIPKEEVISSVLQGEVIEEYPDDLPYPTFLLLCFRNDLPLHVVVALDKVDMSCYIITVYRPDTRIWMPDFKTRRVS